jgi:hypothetical protein
MGYLDKSTITVDAILTNRGRELLAQGTGTGNFQITKFAIADDEVDYRLYNTAHPLGTNYYGAIIENMPVLEATPDDAMNMRYKLVTITSDELLDLGTAIIPQVQIESTAIPETGVVSIFHDASQGTTSIVLRPKTTYTSTLSETESSYTLVLSDGSLGTVEVITPATGVVTVNTRGSVVASGREFRVTALNKTGTATITVFGAQSGATRTFTLSTTASA